MKILVVAHRFPPRHQTGAENYSWRLARELSRRHDVVVFAADDDLMKRNYSRSSRQMDGIRVIEIQNHRRYDTFAESYADPQMERHFQNVLRTANPDIVHFQHLMHHSVSYPRLAREAGIPSVLTLHEFWLLCARNGQLVQGDGERCDGPGLDRCARCVKTFLWGRNNIDLWMLRGLDGVRRLTGVDLKARARKIRLRKLDRAPDDSPVDESVEGLRKDLLLREASVRDMFDMVDCFLAPSAFLKQRFIDFGLESDRILLNGYGTELSSFQDLPVREPSEKLRVGYFGSIQPLKGVHVLVQALQDLDPQKVEAKIWGDLSAKPEYVATLRKNLSPQVALMGQIEGDLVPTRLASLDVLVVPSTWWENAPLVIHEAFAAGVPVICSDVGGMAELVDDGVNGLHFSTADPSSLALAISRILDEEGLLDQLRQGIPKMKSMVDDATFHGQLFTAIVQHFADASEEAEEELDFSL